MKTKTEARDAEARDQAWREAEREMDSAVSRIAQSAADLRDTTRAIADGAPLDRDDLRGYIASLTNALDEMRYSALSMADVADEDRRRAREVLAARNLVRGPGTSYMENTAPRGAYPVVKLRVYAIAEDHRWHVLPIVDPEATGGRGRPVVKDYDLAQALRHACGFFTQPSPACEEMAEDVVTSLMERRTHLGDVSISVDVEVEVERVGEILRERPDATIVNGHDVECCSPDGNHLGVCPTDGAS